MDNEQMEKFLNAIDEDVRELRRVVGLWDADRGLIKKVADIEKRLDAMEYAAQMRTTLIYASIIIGLANLLAVIGLYVRM